MTTVLDATKELGNRFRLVGVLSIATLGLYILALLASGAPSQAPRWDQLTTRVAALKPAEVVIIAVALLVLAVVVQPLQLPLVRLLEGYWGETLTGRLLAEPGKRYHRAQRQRLDRLQQRLAGDDANLLARREDAARRLRAYPPADAVLPTALGNTLRSAEINAGDRYGLDTATMWPRLYPLLPDKLMNVVNDLRDQLDVTARFCAVFLIATGVGVGLLARFGWWLVVPGTTAALAWLCYRAAIASAAAYGRALDAAFDLHRFDLLAALHLPLPVDLAAELDANQQLTRFLRAPQEEVFRLRRTGRGINFHYKHANADPVSREPAQPREGWFARIVARLTR